MRGYAVTAAAACLGAAAVALVNFGLEFARQPILFPTFPRTTANAALGMVLVATTVLLRLERGPRWRRGLGHLTSTLAIAVGLLTLAEFLLGFDLGLSLIGRELPVHTSPQTGVTLVFLGAGLLWLRSPRVARWAQFALAAGLFVPLVTTHAYLHNALDLVGPPYYEPYVGMGPLTAFGFLAGAIGAMLVEPKNPVTQWLPQRSEAGSFVRFAGVLLILVLPLGLAAALASGRALGWYDSRTLVALFGTAFSLGSAFVVVQFARTIERRETERRAILEVERRARATTEIERARLAAVLDSAPIGILVVNGRTGATTLNPTLAEMLQMPATSDFDDVGAALGRLLAPNGAPLAREELPSRRVLAGEALKDEPFRVQRSDGSSFPVSVDGSPVRGPNGEIGGACLTFHDTSAREELDELRNQYMSLVSHDLNSPVASILMGAQLLESQLEDAGLPTRTASLIGRNAKRVHDMIEDLNDVTRLEGGLVRLRPRALDVRNFLASVVEHAVPIDQRKHVHVDVHPLLGTFVADPYQLERVLTNLLENALRYGEPKTPIEVSAQPERRGLRLSVHNRGPRLTAEDAKRIFDKHYRAASERTRGPGLGLGLYICRLITEAHGGRIWAESADGEGVTVHVRLPGPSRVAMPISA